MAPLRRLSVPLAASTAALLATPALAASTAYTVDPTHTAVYFGASHFDRITVRGRFNKIDGRILYDPANGTGSIDFTVDTDSVDTGNRSLDGVLHSAQFLDSQAFPTARLQANRFIVEGGKLVAVEGSLSLHGVTKPIKLEADRFSCGEVVLFGIKRNVCGGDFRTTLPRSAFGITRFLPDVGDTVTLQISVEASPGGTAQPSGK
ncbi:YceI family protein [Cupriavidus sp. BIS7]|uniref:YceI family protein n=1 Tax=Cupriavidus sp. BIS7 TaxID=1217718 RepID=UPI0003079F47|nr:YceI family protein [Cupriavidus sp. BIS7]